MERFMATVHRLAACFQALEAASTVDMRGLGLTAPQFAVIATLGEKSPVTCRELGERTLITKGTLTGILDRLEGRGLVSRTPSPVDRRGVLVRLEPAGQRLLAIAMPRHLAHLRDAFGELAPVELDQLDGLLERLTTRLTSAGDASPCTSPKVRMIAAARRAH